MIYFLPCQSSHLKHATCCKLKPGAIVAVLLCSVNLSTPPNSSHALPRKAIQVGRRCLTLWRPRLWHDVGTCRFWCGLYLFYFIFASRAQLAESTNETHPLRSAKLAQRRSTAPYGVVPCRAVPCSAVLSGKIQVGTCYSCSSRS